MSLPDPGGGGGYIPQIIGKDVLTSTYGATAETLSTSTTTHVTKVSSSRAPSAPTLAVGLGKVTAIAVPYIMDREDRQWSSFWSAMYALCSVLWVILGTGPAPHHRQPGWQGGWGQDPLPGSSSEPWLLHLIDLTCWQDLEGMR